MAIRTVVTAGFGNGTFNGTIKDVVLRGYSIGAAVIITGDPDNVAYVLFNDRRAYVLFSDRRAFAIFKDKRSVS